MSDCATPCSVHPRNDCCVPSSQPPCLPKCGVFVQRTKPIRPDPIPAFSCAPFTGLTTYREHFFPKCGPRTLSFKPDSAFDPSCAPLEGISTYRSHFYPKCGPRAQSMKPAHDFDPSCAPMDGISTYRKDFVGCHSDRAKSLKPANDFDPSCAPMDGLTTYRVNYVPYCPREYGWAKQGSAKVAQVGDLSCAPMDGVTTYRADFYVKCGPRAQSLKPNTRPAFSDARFADCTTYRNDFNPFTFSSGPGCGIFACGAGDGC